LTSSAYPVGQCWRFHAGPMTIEHEIRSMTSIHARHVEGPLAGQQELLSVKIVPLRDALFVVSWQEADSSTVVHVEDFESRSFVSCVITADAKFLQFQGAMVRAPQEWPAGVAI
jgi:hypothetical protein